MQKSKIFQNIGVFAGIFALLILFISCERNDYELLDPASAGVWTLYNTTDGLPGNNVSDIKLDSDENLWMTFPGQGVAKYSEGTWTYFKTATSPLLSNIVTCVAETSDGRIIFGTSTGISILSGTSNTWTSYLDPMVTMAVTAVKVASNGTVWVGTAGQGFYVNSGSGFAKTTVEAFKTISVRAIEEDATGNIWIGTDNGLIKWNGSTYSFLNVANGLPDKRISTILKDSKSKLWIGTKGGKSVSWIDTKGIHQLSLLTGRDSCSINDIYEDRSGNIWFATDSVGVIRYNGIIPRIFNVASKFPENTVNTIGEDKYGNIWFGLTTKGVVRYTLPIN
jgi:ligand-binding sensor domain-containing protein